jgi:hypothetical protein
MNKYAHLFIFFTIKICIYQKKAVPLHCKTKTKNMKAEVGKYHFGRLHNLWGIWQYDYVSEDGRCTSSRKIENCATAEQAYRRIYELNGWGTPKYIPTWMTK